MFPYNIMVNPRLLSKLHNNGGMLHSRGCVCLGITEIKKTIESIMGKQLKQK